MKNIKLFEEFNNYQILKFYKVQYWDDDLEIIYSGNDYDSAKEEFDNFDSSDIDNNITGVYDRRNDIYEITLSLEEKINRYEYIYDEDIEDYPLEDYYDDTDIYVLIDESEYESLENKSVETPYSIDIRKKRDLKINFNSDVINYVKSITSENKYAAFLDSTFYALKHYKDGFIIIRVADHFFNISNVNLGKDVIYKNLQDLPQYNEYRNIYGFISINILDENSNDKRGFRGDFRDWKNYHTELKNLVDYIDIDLDNIDELDWESEINSLIDEMENNIDIALENDIFE